MDTILIVDDSSFIVDGLIAFLKKKYRPLAAYGGAECLEILRREKPSVIILDIMMEPMDGWETLSRIKENPETRFIPVLMFSALKISPEEAEEHRISIDDCLTKPVSPNKIVEAIEKVLARRDTNRVIIGRWQAAGIPRERIDEYLSLATNLEVDLSLCQNMRIQYDITHPKDKNEDEFQAMIDAIETRVVEERNQIETLAREMNRILETGGDESAIPADIASRENPGSPDDPAPDSSRHDGRAPSAEEAPHPAPQEVPGSGSEKNSVEPASGQASALPEDIPLHDEQAAPPLADEPVPELKPADSTRGDASGTEYSARPEEPRTGVPAPEYDHRGLSSGEQEPGASPDTPALAESIPEPLPEDPSLRGLSGSDDPAVTTPASDRRNVIPADPDIPLGKDDSRAGDPTGAGTDIPMPWDLPADRKLHESAKGIIPGKRIPGMEPAARESPAGLFSRIVSLVRSLFRKH